jgi:glycine/D-amino acid oxidase-like deaminating enzyme
MIQSFDVAIIGAGVFGAWTAYQLRAAGANVVLIDAYGPGNNRASSGGESRIIRMGYGPDEIYTRSAQRSLTLWRELFDRIEPSAKSTPLRLFQQTGVLWLAHQTDPYCEATLATLQSANVRFEKLSREELNDRYPQLDFGAVAWGILEPDSGALMARRAVQAIVTQTERDGTSFLAEAILPPTGTGKLQSISTSHGKQIIADQFVFACGPWLPKLFPDLLADFIHVTRQEVFFFGVPAGDNRFSPERMPVWIDFNDLVYAIPDLDNRGFKIAIDAHGPSFDSDTGERIVTAAGLTVVRDYLQLRVPLLANAPLTESRVCQYENTSNGDFLIDRHPDLENLWLVGGGSGHGFKHGPAIGEYVTKLVSGTQQTEPRYSFSTKEKAQQRQVY